MITLKNWDTFTKDGKFFLISPTETLGPFDTKEDAISARAVDFNDIKGHSEPDDCFDTPWDSCDGWEHDAGRIDPYEIIDMERQGAWHSGRGSKGYITITDEQVVAWGITGPRGCSKQVRAETIARAKSKAIEQLVKWYTHGWEESCACASYGEYTDSLGGIIDGGDYLEECIEEVRLQVADQLEEDGYTVYNQPTPVVYSRVDLFRDKIKRQLNCA